jgi:C1A family cysteine protease
MLTREQMKATLKRKKDLFDIRDFPFSITVPIKLPKYSYLVNYIESKVEDQGSAGSCTGQAGSTAIEMDLKYHKKVDFDLSARFLYYCELVLQGEIADTGAYMRTICEAGRKFGICPESLCPYDDDKILVKPSDKAFAEATKIKIKTYEKLSLAKEIKACIAKARHPVLVGFPVFSNFFDVGKSGIMPMPGSDDNFEGGHAVVAYGYDEKGIWIRNSWGSSWGKNGNFRMPWEFYGKYLTEIDAYRIISVSAQ